jgi:hypothetical protein
LRLMGRRVECALVSLDLDFLIGTGAVSHNEIAGASRDLDASWARFFPHY